MEALIDALDRLTTPQTRGPGGSGQSRQRRAVMAAMMAALFGRRTRD